MRLDTLPDDLYAVGCSITFRRDGSMSVKGTPDAGTVDWLKANREAVRMRWSPYILMCYRLPTGVVLFRPMGKPADQPPPTAVAWKWAQDSEWSPIPRRQEVAE